MQLNINVNEKTNEMFREYCEKVNLPMGNALIVMLDRLNHLEQMVETKDRTIAVLDEHIKLLKGE